MIGESAHRKHLAALNEFKSPNKLNLHLETWTNTNTVLTNIWEILEWKRGGKDERNTETERRPVFVQNRGGGNGEMRAIGHKSFFLR